MSGYYLFKQENDLFRIFFIALALNSLHVLFYGLHSAIFSGAIKKRNILVNSATAFPQFIFLLISFGIPAAYILLKKNLEILELETLFSVLIVNGTVIFFLWAGKIRKAKKIAESIGSVSGVFPKDFFKADDPNEFGLIETALLDFGRRWEKEKENISLMNEYVSQNIKNQMIQYGLNLNGELKTATVMVLKYLVESKGLTPEMELATLNSITKIIGNFAEEYDAYPVFQLNKVFLIYGVPFYYEHQKYNALESAERMIADLEKFAASQETTVKISVGIFTGNLVVGAVYSRGKNYKEYSAFGEAMDAADRVAAACESTKSKVLICSRTIEGLRGKFTFEKSYKLKQKDGKEIDLFQLKL
jgi:hypothetical protein